MDQILSAITAFFASILAMFSMGGQPASQVATPTPTQMISKAPESTEKVIYKGVSPCGDCAGIDITLTLNYDGADNISGTYSQSFAYQEKPAGNYTDTGTWKGGLPNDVIELTPKNGGQPQYYQQATIPTLVALGANMQQLPPPGNYVLTAE